MGPKAVAPAQAGVGKDGTTDGVKVAVGVKLTGAVAEGEAVTVTGRVAVALGVAVVAGGDMGLTGAKGLLQAVPARAKRKKAGKIRNKYFIDIPPSASGS